MKNTNKHFNTMKSFVPLLAVLAALCVACVSGTRRGEKGASEFEQVAKKADLKRMASTRFASAMTRRRKLSTAYPTVSPTLSPAPTTIKGPETENTNVVCFSGAATARVLDQGAVAMKDLKIGDRVLTGSGAYSPIYSFGHFEEDESAEFIQIRTSGRGGRPLEISSEHMVFLKGETNHPVRADAVRVGDVVLDHKGEGATVTKINKQLRTGVFAPLTVEGTVVVDGLVASNYVAFFGAEWEATMPSQLSQHTYVHWAISPLRLVCRMAAPRLLCDTYNEDGYPHYVAFGMKLNQLAAGQHVFAEFLVLALILVLVGTVRCVEYLLLDASMIVSLLAAGSMVTVAWWMRKRSLIKA